MLYRRTYENMESQSGKSKLQQPNKRRILQFALASTATMFAASCRNNEFKGFAAGDRFPDLLLPRLDGQSAPLALNSDAALIVNFWATWCGPCRLEMPDLEKLGTLFSPKDLVVIGITVDTDRNLAREFVLQNKLTFPMLSDSDQELSSNILRVPGYPATYLLKRDRTIARIIIGVRNWADPGVIREIEEALGVQANPK